MPRLVVVSESPTFTLSVREPNQLSLRLTGPAGPAGPAGVGGGSASIYTGPDTPDPELYDQWNDTEDGSISFWYVDAWVSNDPSTLPDPDSSAPLLSAVSATEGDTEATLTATSDQSGMMYFYISLSATPEDPADIVAGTGSWLQYDAAVCAAGDPVVLLVTGLTNGVTYYFHAMAANEFDLLSDIEVVSFVPEEPLPFSAFVSSGGDYYTTSGGDYFITA